MDRKMQENEKWSGYSWTSRSNITTRSTLHHNIRAKIISKFGDVDPRHAPSSLPELQGWRRTSFIFPIHGLYARLPVARKWRRASRTKLETPLMERQSKPAAVLPSDSVETELTQPRSKLSQVCSGDRRLLRPLFRAYSGRPRVFHAVTRHSVFPRVRSGVTRNTNPLAFGNFVLYCVNIVTLTPVFPVIFKLYSIARERRYIIWVYKKYQLFLCSEKNHNSKERCKNY